MNKTSKTTEEKINNFKIKYKKYPFSKSIRVTLKNEDTILVTMPCFCPLKKAKEFLRANFNKIEDFNLKNKPKFIQSDFKTKFNTLNIIKSSDLKEYTKIKTKNKIVYFYYQDSIDFYSDKIQKPLLRAYQMALKIEAQDYLTKRIYFLAEKYNFNFAKISLRNQKTRFGSCSFCNNISLNINLMKYDFDVIDYVLIHELCHTKIKNHSRKFWLEVEKYCPNWKSLRKKLKQSL